MNAAAFKRARKSLGFTQNQMGEALGRSVRMIKYYESGRKIPRLVVDKIKSMVAGKC